MDQQAIDSVRFLGNVLGPLFFYDPHLDADAVAPLYQAFAQADAAAMAAEWPFGGQERILPPLQAMTEGAKAYQAETEGDPDPLTTEYRRLFIGPGPKAAPPWGSVYTDRDCVVFGESTLALRDWLRAQGITVNRGDSDEPEDHIGTMLLLLSWMADQKPQAIPEYLQLHLLPWAPHFLDGMEAAAQEPFFQGLAALTRESLLALQSELGLEVEVPRFYR